MLFNEYRERWSDSVDQMAVQFAGNSTPLATTKLIEGLVYKRLFGGAGRFLQVIEQWHVDTTIGRYGILEHVPRTGFVNSSQHIDGEVSPSLPGGFEGTVYEYDLGPEEDIINVIVWGYRQFNGGMYRGNFVNDILTDPNRDLTDEADIADEMAYATNSGLIMHVHHDGADALPSESLYPWNGTVFTGTYVGDDVALHNVYASTDIGVSYWEVDNFVLGEFDPDTAWTVVAGAGESQTRIDNARVTAAMAQSAINLNSQVVIGEDTNPAGLPALVASIARDRGIRWQFA